MDLSQPGQMLSMAGGGGFKSAPADEGGGAEWGGTYIESFTTDTGGWVVVGDALALSLSRSTSGFDTTPACLQTDFLSQGDTAGASKILPGPQGSYSLSLRVRGTILGSLMDFSILGLDSGDNTVDSIDLTGQTPASGSYSTINVAGTLVGAAIQKIAILVFIPATVVTAFDNDLFRIDTVQLEKTA